jgi:formylmethanofuran dehydrogenase subunit E
MAMNKDDWRLQGQEDYLQGVKLVKQKYSPQNPENDHDHCEFCGEKFMVNHPNTLSEGYSTEDRYRWVCEACYNDFKNDFDWK